MRSSDGREKRNNDIGLLERYRIYINYNWRYKKMFSLLFSMTLFNKCIRLFYFHNKKRSKLNHLSIFMNKIDSNWVVK